MVIYFRRQNSSFLLFLYYGGLQAGVKKITEMEVFCVACVGLLRGKLLENALAILNTQFFLFLE
jgi:hypothetical protein